MKKFIFTTSSCLMLLLLCSNNTFAQYKYFVGGNLNLNYTTTTPTTNNSGSVSNINGIHTYSILPYAGAFVSDNIIVGLGLGHEGLITKSDNGSLARYSAVVINPFVRYRVPASEKIGLYGELGGRAKFATLKNLQGGEVVKSKINTFGTYLGFGADYALSDRWVINGFSEVLNYSTNQTPHQQTSTVGLNFNPARIRFGLNYRF